MIASKAFKVGFILSCFIFGILQFKSSSSDCPADSRTISFDCYETYGFPFVMHEYGSVAHLNGFIWSGVIANLTIAIISGLIFGIGFRTALPVIYKKLGLPR